MYNTTTYHNLKEQYCLKRRTILKLINTHSTHRYLKMEILISAKYWFSGLLVAGDFAPAERARVIVGEPRSDTRCMVHVATGDLFTTLTWPEAFDANWANMIGCSNRWHVHYQRFRCCNRTAWILRQSEGFVEVEEYIYGIVWVCVGFRRYSSHGRKKAIEIKGGAHGMC